MPPADPSGVRLPRDIRRIGACVSFHAARGADREAAVAGTVRMTYRDLDRSVQRWAKAFLAAGLGHGDRVAMLAPASTEWLAVMLAVTDIGAIWTGFHPRYRLPEFRHVTALTGPKVLVAFRHIHGRDYATELRALRSETPTLVDIVMIDEPLDDATMAGTFLEAGADISDRDLDRRRDAVTIDDTAVLIFTSGTTGRPKAAMVRHRALLVGARVENEHWPMTRPRLLHMMPVNHIAGIGMTAVFALWTGGTLVFQSRFDAGDLLRLIEGEMIDHVLGSPVQFHMMAHHADAERRDLGSLKYITWGGAPMAASLVARLNGLPGHLCTSFGMTELGLYVTFTRPDDDFEVLSSTIGRPHADFDIRIADADGNITPPGGRGEIQARGPWLLAGYWGDAEATRQAYTADGWFRTGDVVRVREDGNLEIVGRTKEMYISGGFNIYPREIEVVLEEHPDVGLVAVMGVPHEVFGEVGHAFVEPLPGALPGTGELDLWCRERLANYKVPKTFEIDQELPRLPIGKIDRQALKERLEARL